jgi:membrane protease YdiL (CAAX protease family)
MGFLQARWQDRFGPLKASVLVTVPFALYHLPGLIVDSHLGVSELGLILIYLTVLAALQMFGRVVMMWMYNVTGSSVLLVGLWHSSFDATTTAFGRTFVLAGPGWKAEMAAFWIPSAVIVVFALLAVALTRGRLGYRTNGDAATADTEPGISPEATAVAHPPR